MNAPISSRHCTTVNTPLIPQIADKCDREGKRAALSAAVRNAIAAPRQASRATAEQRPHR